MRGAKKFKKDTPELFPSWFAGGAAARRDVYMLFLESASKADEPSDRAFAFEASPGMGYIRLILPVSRLEADPAGFLALARDLEQGIDPDFGQAGLAVNWNFLAMSREEPVQGMHALGNRYPGIDMSKPFATQFIVGKGIKGVNWLTFLGRSHVAALGGEDAIRKAAGRDVVVHPTRSGLALQAGPVPDAGDVNRRVDLPAYRAVARLVAPVRSHEHPGILGADGFEDPDATEKWLARFEV
jgi:hypothetical protein